MLTKELLIELQEYVDRRLVTLAPAAEKCAAPPEVFSYERSCEYIGPDGIDTYVKNKKKPSFNQTLFKYIDKIGISDADVYKKAGIDRRHFSKIRSNPDYHPGKNTVIALSLALELSKKEAGKLLASAGYTLSDSETFDLVIAFCFEHRIYSIDDVNLALDYFSLKPLAGAIE